jgi:uncharacterized protein YdeI (YjbR/CyaY-like superfamily)
MAKGSTNPKVDFFFNASGRWQEEFLMLRAVVLKAPLTEQLKWGQPCYSVNNSNIVLIHGFKEYCALLFFKGALMKDPAGILIQQTENVQAARQIRFTSSQEISKMEKTLKAYVKEAMAVEAAGLKVEFKKPSQFKMAEEFQQKLDKNPKLKKAFESLTPGRQRAYLLYFSSPKQSQTRAARVGKYTPQILSGKGLDD